MSAREDFLDARAVLLAVREVPGGGQAACDLYDALEAGDPAQARWATERARRVLAELGQVRE